MQVVLDRTISNLRLFAPYTKDIGDPVCHIVEVEGIGFVKNRYSQIKKVL